MSTTQKIAKAALLFALLLFLAFYHSACVTHSNVGGEGQTCSNKGVCEGDLTCCESQGNICIPYDVCHPADGDPDTVDSDEADNDTAEAEEEVVEQPEADSETEILPLPNALSGKVCSPSGLCLLHPYPIGFSLTDAWLAPDGGFWFVGEQGLRGHFPTNSAKPALDGVFSGALPTLHGIHGTAKDAIWAVGEQNTILFYDGKTWSAQHDPLIDTTEARRFNAVHADGQGNLYVLGNGGLLLRQLNKTWSVLGTPNTADLFDMWNSGTDTYVIVGDKGALFMSKNQYLFTAKTSGTSEALRSVWGSSANRIFAVGDKGTVLYYDGTSWAPFSFPFPDKPAADGDAETALGGFVKQPDFLRVRGAGEKVVLFAGDGSLWDLTEGDNAEYSDVKDAPEFFKTHLFTRRTSNSASYALRGGATRQDGAVLAVGDYGVLASSRPTEATFGLYPNPEGTDASLAKDGHSVYPDVSALSGTSTKLFVGASNGLALQYNETSSAWTASDALKGGLTVGDIWPFADGNTYFFQDRIFVLDTTGSFGELVGPEILGQRLKRAVGFADTSFYAVGEYVVHFKTSLQRVNEPFIAKSYVESAILPTIADSKGPWNAIWAASADELWVGGGAGTIAHRVKNPYSAAVSSSEYIWQTETLSPAVDINDIWGTDAGHLWLVGNDGTIWIYDGATFSVVGPGAPYQTGENLTRVFGTDATHLLVASDLGHLWLSRNGKDFKPLDSGTGGALLAAYARSEQALFLAGENGLILKAEHLFDATTEPDGDQDADPDTTDNETSTDGDLEAETDAVEPDGDTDNESVEQESDTESESDSDADQDTDTLTQSVFSCRTPSDPTLTCGPDCFCQLSPSLFGKPLTALNHDGAGNLLAVTGEAVYRKTDTGWAQLTLGGLKSGETLIGAIQAPSAKKAEAPLYVLSNTALYKLVGSQLTELKAVIYDAALSKTSRFVAIDQDSAGTLYLLESNPDKTFSLYRQEANGSYTALASHRSFTVGAGGTTIVTSLSTPTPTRLYVAGTNVMRYNGSSWLNLNRPTGDDTPHLRVRAFAATNTIVTIMGNTAYTYDGTSWGVLPLSPVMYPADIWGTSLDNLIVVGQSTEAVPANRKGLALRRESNAWQPVAGFTAINPKVIYGKSDGSLIVVGGAAGEILSASSSDYVFSANQNAPLASVDLRFVTGGGSAVYCGGAGLLFSQSGSGFAALLPNPALSLPESTVFQSGDCDAAGRLYLTSDQSKVVLYDPSQPSWAALATSRSYQGIAAASPTDFYLGASLDHYTGTGFDTTTWDAGIATPNAAVEPLFVGGTLYAAGGADGLLTLNGTTVAKDAAWPADKTALHLATNGATLYVAATLTATGELRVLSKATGGIEDITLNLPATLSPLDVAASGSLVYLLAASGTSQQLWAYDGTLWAQVKAFPQSGIAAIYAASPYDLYAVGANGLILHQQAEEVATR